MYMCVYLYILNPIDLAFLRACYLQKFTDLVPNLCTTIGVCARPPCPHDRRIRPRAPATFQFLSFCSFRHALSRQFSLSSCVTHSFDLLVLWDRAGTAPM